MKRPYPIRVTEPMRPVLKQVADILNKYPECAESIIEIASRIESSLRTQRLRAAQEANK